MFFLPISLLFFLILIVLLPILLIFIPIHIMGLAFQKLGLSAEMGFTYFIFSLVGSAINIPLKEETCYQEPELSPLTRLFYGQVIIPVKKRVLAINVGGAIIPMVLAFYLLFTQAPLMQTVIATAVMIVITKFLARPVPNVGIAMPALIPPICSVILAWILHHQNPAPVAYVSGVLGTLIGADILNLKRIKHMSCGVMSIGGAGVFDGIYLVGIIAVLLA
ncbi:MAG: DUF1614 domain-containing protein [candidate division WOR-3 bacterium]|nr:MAG: DUF1614 domain-containing protein [candidate division WOR-3 bacterium]